MNESQRSNIFQKEAFTISRVEPIKAVYCLDGSWFRLAALMEPTLGRVLMWVRSEGKCVALSVSMQSTVGFSWVLEESTEWQS